MDVERPSPSATYYKKVGRWPTRQINMNTSQIDSIIVSVVGEHWTKVEMRVTR
jgi:hypothetical protein